MEKVEFEIKKRLPLINFRVTTRAHPDDPGRGGGKNTVTVAPFEKIQFEHISLKIRKIFFFKLGGLPFLVNLFKQLLLHTLVSGDSIYHFKIPLFLDYTRYLKFCFSVI